MGHTKASQLCTQFWREMTTCEGCPFCIVFRFRSLSVQQGARTLQNQFPAYFLDAPHQSCKFGGLLKIFQSSTFGYAILRKLLKTSKLLHSSNPPLLVTQSYENFLQKLLKTSYENFSKLPILHFSLRKLPIPPVFVTKTSDSSTFGYENSSRKLLIPRLWLQKLKTSNSSTFGYENLKLPILSQTSDSSNLKTWKTLPSSYNFKSSPTWTFL